MLAKNGGEWTSMCDRDTRDHLPWASIQNNNWAQHLAPRALPPWAQHLAPRALPPWAEHLAPRALPPNLVPRAFPLKNGWGGKTPTYKLPTHLYARAPIIGPKYIRL